jgi:hypothetical protein
VSREDEGAPPPVGRRSAAQVWAARLGLLLWLLVLVTLPSIVPEPGSVSWPRLSSRMAGELLQSAGHLLWLVTLQVLAFAPLGFLAVYALPDRASWRDRLLRVMLPAACLGLVFTVLARGLSASGDWVAPGMLQLVLPLAGVLFGLWLGGVWRRGPRARAWILPKLTLATALVAVLVLVLARRAVESAPLPLEPPHVTTEDRHHLSALLRGKNPETIPAGETRSLRLSEDEVNRLLAMGLELSGDGRSAKVELAPDGIHTAASLALPGGRALGRRFLNVQVTGRPVVAGGSLRLDLSELSVGALRVPRWLLGFATPLTGSLLRSEPRLAPTVAAIRDVQLGDHALEISYGRTTLPRGFLRELMREAAGTQDLLPAVRAHAEHLVRVADSLPRGGEQRFAAALESAFAFAHERSPAGGKVEENRAAIIALGTLLGHWRVQTLVGAAFDDKTLKAGLRAYGRTTVRGRRDWVQHYLVSASLAAVADVGVSQAAGILKEEMDSRGGSGFSFGDLLADRSGTAFGSVATRDETSAEAIQDHLARGFRIDDFFPRADDLPENLPEPELKARFGGVGGERYRRIVGIIDGRVAACVAYRF